MGGCAAVIQKPLRGVAFFIPQPEADLESTDGVFPTEVTIDRLITKSYDDLVLRIYKSLCLRVRCTACGSTSHRGVHFRRRVRSGASVGCFRPVATPRSSRQCPSTRPAALRMKHLAGTGLSPRRSQRLSAVFPGLSGRRTQFHHAARARAGPSADGAAVVALPGAAVFNPY